MAVLGLTTPPSVLAKEANGALRDDVFARSAQW
jgi:hypothetical protein